MDSRIAGGIVAVVIGLFLLVGGVAAYFACLSTTAVGGGDLGCGGFGVVVLFGLVFLLLGIISIARGLSTTYVASPVDPAVPPPLIHPVVIQTTVERQVVKVRCRYCATLADQGVPTCPNCGAPL